MTESELAAENERLRTELAAVGVELAEEKAAREAAVAQVLTCQQRFAQYVAIRDSADSEFYGRLLPGFAMADSLSGAQVNNVKARYDNDKPTIRPPIPLRPRARSPRPRARSSRRRQNAWRRSTSIYMRLTWLLYFGGRRPEM